MERLAFHQRLRLERMKRGWSQDDLAGEAGVEPKTVWRWEKGERIPRSQNLQQLCKSLNMTPVELGLLDMRSLRPAKPSPFPSSSLLEQALDVVVGAQLEQEQTEALVPPQLWRSVPRVPSLPGRLDELVYLEKLLLTEHCRVVAVLGIGGVGKTTLAARLAGIVRPSFVSIFWCNLKNAPPLEQVLPECIQVLSGHTYASLPAGAEDQIAFLIHHICQQRCLLILDNVESILQSGRTSGSFREGYEHYGTLIRSFGEGQHNGCLLLTSCEKPAEVGWLESPTAPVRSFQLQGLKIPAGGDLLRKKGLSGSDSDLATLVQRYSGNPLALNLVAEPIRTLFGGDIARFLLEGQMSFGNLNDLLAQQVRRLSPREYALLSWLAIEREPVSLEQLRENLVQSFSKKVLLEDLTSLCRRSIIEQPSPTTFTLQPVIMEYVTSELVESFVESFSAELKGAWGEYALIQAQAHDYVRESQSRFLMAPVAQCLLERRTLPDLVRAFQLALATERLLRPNQSNYLAANVLNLLTYVQANMHGLDCSDLVIWQAHLQAALLPSTNFSRATFIASTFVNTSGNVLSTAFSPERNLFAIGTATNEVWLYEPAAGTPFSTYRAHTDGVWSVAFSPNGHYLASSSDDHTILLWNIQKNIQSEHYERQLLGHKNRIKSIAFSPDSQCLASGSDDSSARLWDVASGECVREFHGHTSRIWSVAFSPDGQTLATASTDEQVCLWDVASGGRLATLRGHQGWVLSVAFSPDGTFLASSGDDKTIRFWDLVSLDTIKILHGHSSRVRSLSFHPDGSLLASASEDRTLCLWDVETGACLSVLRGHTHGVRSVAFNPRGTLLASGADDQTTRLWDVANARCLKTLQGYTHRVWALAFSPDGQMLLSASEDQKMRLWQVHSGTCLRVIPDSGYGVLCVAFSPTGGLFATGGEDRIIRLWQATSGSCIKTLTGHTNWIRAIAFSADGAYLASGSEDHAILLWETASGQSSGKLLGHTSWIRALAFSPDGRMLASCGDDKTVRLWDLASGLCLEILGGHTSQVRSVAFSPDSLLLASAGEDNVIYLWDTTTYNFRTFTGHKSWVRSVAFSPDGSLLVSGGDDKMVCLWDVETGTCLQVLAGHSERVRSVAFSPLGDLFASSSDDGSIRFWHPQTFASLGTLVSERPYERMQITDAQGLTEAQRATLKVLGAFE
jgi:WD40 repeat protein/transcriptional regulator with XRE-family HTH domain